MSKEGRVRGGRGSNGKSSSVPYATITRRERSRKLAQKRRDIYKQIMEDMIDVMPFPKDVVSQLDYNSRLRLTICFFRTKAMLKGDCDDEEPLAITAGGGEEACLAGFEDGEGNERLALCKAKPQPSLFPMGMLQDLMSESLDGFLMVTQLDGNIIFLSESIHKHLGLFQSEHIGINMYDLILEEDHADVKERLADADERSVKRKTKHGTTEVSFFCRMKCSRFKMANSVTKSPGYKLVYVSGTLKVAGSEPFIACVVRPVSAPSVLELRTEGNMFVAHYSMEFSCIYFDGRLRHLLGYTREDFMGKTPFSFQHHDDIEATMQCSREVQSKGEGVSGYYRFLNRFGEYIWIQSRAVIAYEGRTGKPSHIVCTSYVISKEDGMKDLLLRQAVASGQSEFIEKNLTAENPFATKKPIDAKNPTNHQNHKDTNGTTKVGGAAYVTKMKRKEPAGTGVANGNQGATNWIEENGDSKDTTPSTSKRTTSVLYSMLASRTVSPLQATSAHQAKTSMNGVRVRTNEETSKEKERSHSSSSLSRDSHRSQSVELIEDGCLPDSTTYSNESSPYNPPSIPHQGNERRSNSVSSHKMSCNDRTTSGSDLGYHSESASSLRDRLASNFTGYESESSMYMYESGAETSPPNVYSPDYPLSVLSSDGSVASGLSFMTGSPSDAQSPFQNPGSIHSLMDEAVGSPTYLLPVDNCEFVNGSRHHQSPNGSLVNGENDLILRSKVGRQWSGSSSSLSSPPQFALTTSPMGNGDAPANYNQRGVAFAKMPSPLSGFARSSGAGTMTNGHMLLPSEVVGSPQYISESPSPQGAVFSPQQRAIQTSSSASVLLSDVTVSSVTSGTSHSISTLQATVSPSSTSKVISSLPQLTDEDLNILDAFDQGREDDQFRQLLYHQTSLSCRGTMMM